MRNDDNLRFFLLVCMDARMSSVDKIQKGREGKDAGSGQADGQATYSR